MGAVYHAWDEELGVGVALKIVRPEIATDPQLARDLEKRFKRELLLARQVTHKNVVRIHDMGEIDGIKYITMPFVEGVELTSILKKNEEGLPVEQVIAVARGIVSGLLAAHHAGVVHRDLKPANIMVESDTGEALIMDFGIARSSSSGSSADSGGKPGDKVLHSPVKAGLTMAGTVVGTLEYMAPEQARGQDVDHRADLYAVGLILYDMLAPGRRARESKGALLELRHRMVKPPPPLTEVRPDLPAPLERIVSRLVEPDADKRYATTDELAAAFDRLDEHGFLRPLPKRFTKKFIAVSVAAVLAALVTTWQIARTRVPPEPPKPMSVLVADFDNRTGDPVFEDSVEAALTVALEGASFISAYPRADAERLLAQLGGSTELDEVAATLVSRREGIKVVLSGTIEPDRSGYRVSIHALDPAVEGGEPLAELSADASDKKAVLEVVARLASRLRGELGDTTPESERLSASETVTASSLEALKVYTRAQALADANQNQEALAAYQETVALDPNFGRAYAGMGVIYTIFKDEAKAKTAYDEALKLVDRMSEREKYRTLGTYYMSVARNYEKAIENYETLVKLYPADDGGHANLGLAYVYTGNVQRALEEVRRVLDIYPSQWAQRYNYAMYSMYAGDFDTAIAEGSRVVKEAPTFELAFVPVALSKLAEGDFEGAHATYDELEHAGPSGAALARFGRADLEIYRGQYRTALKILEEAIALDEKAGNTGILAQDYAAVAEVYLALGQPNRAVAAARKAATLSAHESVLFPAAMTFLEANLPDEAEKIALTLDNMLQTHTTAYARLIDAELLSRKGRKALAVETFRDSIKRRDTWFARYLLGKLYAETEHFPEAMAELDLCASRRGEVTDVFVYDTPSLRYLPRAYYWLARSQQAMGVANAPASYEKFLALRGNADPPDPLAEDARGRISP
jgi:tetratricopeptide (TPR) repeat protein/tRNA A-37 threonylcarbamoyl transferase component Bud32